MNERAIEIKVGIFVVVAALILLGFVVAIGDISLGRTWPLHVEYNFSGSIHPGAPVRLSGQQIGRVSRVELIGEEKRDAEGRPLLVRLRLEMDDRAMGLITEEAAFRIGTAGVLGEAYVDVDTGGMRGAGLGPGDTVRGADAPRTDLLLARASHLIDTLGALIESDAETVRELMLVLGRFLGQADALLTESGGDLSELVSTGVRAARDLAAFSQAARGLLDEGDLQALVTDGRAAMSHLRDDLPGLLAAGRRVSEQLEQTMEVVSEIEAEDIERMRDALARFEETGARLEELTVEVRGIVERVERGEGTLGALLQDDQVYEDLSELLSDVRRHPWKLLRRR